jgi:predicted ester cyclase
MTVAPAAPATAVRAFIEEYFRAWQGTDEAHIMSYYTEDVSLQIPGALMRGRAAVRDQFVHPFITGFPGNRHIAQNMIFGENVVVVEWAFRADHKGPFAGIEATGAHVDVLGCSIYAYDLAERTISGGRVYFDTATLLKQIGAN